MKKHPDEQKVEVETLCVCSKKGQRWRLYMFFIIFADGYAMKVNAGRRT